MGGEESSTTSASPGPLPLLYDVCVDIFEGMYVWMIYRVCRCWPIKLVRLWVLHEFEGVGDAVQRDLVLMPTLIIAHLHTYITYIHTYIHYPTADIIQPLLLTSSDPLGVVMLLAWGYSTQISTRLKHCPKRMYVLNLQYCVGESEVAGEHRICRWLDGLPNVLVSCVCMYVCMYGTFGHI